jgi:hypothetical protein
MPEFKAMKEKIKEDSAPVKESKQETKEVVKPEGSQREKSGEQKSAKP